MAQTGHPPIEPASTTVDGHPASVFTVTGPTSQQTDCAGDAITIFDSLWLRAGQTATVYVVDVEGSALVLAIRDATADELADFEAVIASMDITRRIDT